MQKVIAIKKDFDKDIYYFLAPENIKVGEKVVVNIDELLTVAEVYRVIDNSNKFEDLKPIKKVATSEDLKRYKELKEKAKGKLAEIKTKSIKLGLEMKFVGAVYSLDNSKIVIIFSSEERVDFRQFLKELAAMFKTRIELKQIGQRDELKIKGGVGQCGQQCCCTRFLKDFTHVSVKMAKSQGLALSPTKINGVCGRLMCCLAYESKQYEEILSKMPKVGSEIITANGKGEVVFNDILRERVSVKRRTEGDSFVIEDFALSELEPKTQTSHKFEHKNEQKHEKSDKKEMNLPAQEENIKVEGNEQKSKPTEFKKKFHKKQKYSNKKFNKNKVSHS